jgi:hypothetical protein
VQAQHMSPQQKGMDLHGRLLSNNEPERNYYFNIGMTVNGKSGSYWLCALEYDWRQTEYRTAHLPLETKCV